MLPNLSYDSIEKYIDIFEATYEDMWLMDPSDRKVQVETARKRLARLRTNWECELELKFSCNGLDIDYAEIEEVIKQARGNLNFESVMEYVDTFQYAVRKVIEEKTKKQELERGDKTDGKGKCRCWGCRIKNWFKNKVSRKG